MKSNENKKSRKEFLSTIFKTGLITTLLVGTPISKILGFTRNPKIYFKENPESVKRQK
jgi:hypothetical protein